MAVTETNLPGNGTAGPFTYTFPALEEAHVKVSVDAVTKTVGVDYTLDFVQKEITFITTPYPTASETIRIYRETDDSALTATFYSGAAIRATDLNDNFTQNLYVTQEIANNSVLTDGSNPIVGDLDMSGYEVINVGTPTSDGAAVNKQYVDSRLGDLDIPGFTRWTYNAVGGETDLSGAGSTGGTLAYSAGREQVYLNGAQQQRGVDYTADNGTNIEFAVALTSGDVVEVICVNNLNTGTTAQAQDVSFVQSGAGADTRSVENKLRDVVSVKDFGAVGDGVTDDTAAIQAAITAAEPYGKRHVYFPAGNYKTAAPILVQQPITLEGAGSSIATIFANHNGDGIVFQPSDAGSANSYLNGGSILHLGVSRNNAGNGGSAVWLRQCNGFKAFDVRAHNHDYGIRISGGQLNTLDTIRTYCFSPYTGGPAGASAGIRLEQADIGSGNYQKCYTVQISNWIATSGKLHSYALSVSMADGLTINGAYLAYYASSHFQFKREITSDYVTAVSISDVYFDGVENTPSGTGGTPRAIYIAPSLTGGNTLRSIRVSNCMLANCRGGQSIVDVREFVDGLGFSNCVFAGCDSVAVNIGPATSAGVNEGHYTFVGNYFRNVLNGIKVTDVDSITISSNTFTDFTGTVGIQFNGLADKVKLTSNTFESAITLPVSNLATASASDLIDLRQEYTGSYTPTATAVANLDNVTISELSYIRINDVVNVFGKIGINPTASGTATRFLLSLPLATNFTATGAAGGTLHSYTTGSASVGGCITADTVSDKVEFNLVPTVTYELSYWFTFSYVIS